MADYMLGQITPFAFEFVPVDYAACNGQLMQVTQNQALFALLYNTYGGDGRNNFALPDLRGTVPVHMNYTLPLPVPAYQQGQKFGAETVTLTAAQMVGHTHKAYGVNVAAVKANNPAGKNRMFANASVSMYAPQGTNTPVQLNAGSLTSTGGGGAHDNMQPFLAVNFCMVISGLFPQRN